MVLLDGTSDRGDYIESLELIRGLDFDLLVPGFATSGLPFYAVTDEADRERRMDELLARVKGGENY